MERRRFLLGASGALLSAPLLASCAREVVRGGRDTGLSRRAWKTVIAAQEHLFPPEPEAPGAREVNAPAYLHEVLSDPGLDPAERAVIRDGALALEAQAQGLGAKGFAALDGTGREAALRALEATPEGRTWIATMLGYVLEALLGDPVYGGNPDGVGWRWLGHRPGFPRPPAARGYARL